MVVLPSPCLVVLVGPSASGKSVWAESVFAPNQVVSSDRLRAMVGEGDVDQRAGTDAFAVLDDIVARRLKRGLTTVIDSLGLEAKRRRAWLALAERHGVACHAVAFDVPAAECRARNKTRAHRVPDAVLAAQLRSWPAAHDALATEGFAGVHAPGPVRLVPVAFANADAAVQRQREDPMPLRFELQIPSFTWPGGPAEIADRLRRIVGTAEDVGFSGIWVMDHFRQIPTNGPAWHDMLESYTTLGFLAAATHRARLGVMVTGITYRNVAHLGKIVATLDVLSGGRAACGLGAAWFGAEHTAYGWPFPPVADRYGRLEDALQLLPLLWGPGTPAFEGATMSVPEAMCYPRPLQEHVPILVGGSGERRTLRLVAQYADACNLFGQADVVRHKVDVLRRHCADVGRDPAVVEVTQLSTVLVGTDATDLDARIEALRPPRTGAERFARDVNAGTVGDHVGRFRELAEAGVQTAVVSLPDLADPAPLERFAGIIAAFR